MKLVAVLLLVAAPVAAQVLPRAPGPHAPSFTAVDTPGGLTGAVVADVETCSNCHQDVAASWRASTHANASFSNPIYRASVLRLVEERGRTASRFCGGCHDPALLVDGALDAEVDPVDPRAHAGVTCRVCHSVTHTTTDGNGSYTLTAAPIPLPRAGDAASVARHVARVAPAPLRTSQLCASCHKVFLDAGGGNAHHLAGQDDATPHARSVFAGSRAGQLDAEVAQRTCQGCHMPRIAAVLGDAAAKKGTVASHRFASAHTWMAAMSRDEGWLAAARELLATAATLDLVVAGRRLDVVLWNAGTGHRFPGGTVDAQDTWVELVVRNAAGRVVAEAGGEHERTGADLTAHRLRALLVGDDGMPLLERETHRFRAVAWNHTLLPREAAVVRYELAGDPVSIEARLRHRTHNLELQRLACAEARSARGARFTEGARRAGKPDLDPCAPQPITDIARATWRSGDLPRWPRWEVSYLHGLGLLRSLQERLEEARPSLLGALAAAPDAAARARVSWALAALEGRTGRPAEALIWLDRAERDVGPHPAIARLRGDALALVWRWPEAVPHLARAASSAPLDDSCWTALAVALGSAGDAAGSLAAAARGLALQPRDPDLLLAQALALGRLGKTAAHAALEAYLKRRPADDSPGLRNRCQKNAPGCVLERNPVHTHELRPR